MKGRSRERLAGSHVGPQYKVALETRGLFDMEVSKIASLDVLFEAFDRAGCGVDGSIVATFASFR